MISVVEFFPGYHSLPMAPWGGNQCPLPAPSGQRAASVRYQSRQQIPQFDIFASAVVPPLLSNTNAIALWVSAYLDVEPHGVWGMRRLFVWCGVGPARARGIPRAAQTAQNARDRRSSESTRDRSRIKEVSRLEESWRALRDNLCVHKGFPPGLTAFRTAQVSKVVVEVQLYFLIE